VPGDATKAKVPEMPPTGDRAREPESTQSSDVTIDKTEHRKLQKRTRLPNDQAAPDRKATDALDHGPIKNDDKSREGDLSHDQQDSDK